MRIVCSYENCSRRNRTELKKRSILIDLFSIHVSLDRGTDHESWFSYKSLHVNVFLDSFDTSNWYTGYADQISWEIIERRAMIIYL